MKNKRPTAYMPEKNKKHKSVNNVIVSNPSKNLKKKALKGNHSKELVKRQKNVLLSNNTDQTTNKINKQKFKNSTVNRKEKNHNQDLKKTFTEKQVSSGADNYDWKPELGGEMKKWYDEFNDEPKNFPKSSEAEISLLRNEAEQILLNETEFYKKKQSKQGQSEKSWMRTVLTKGTASDKVAANVVTIQEAPVYNLSAIISLVNMVKVAKKKECMLVMETLTELFLTDLLKPQETLKSFEQHPLSLLNQLTSGNAISRRHRLAYWMFEDRLKRLYVQFLNAIDIVGKDTIETNREKAVTAMYKLLSGNVEQSNLLLKTLVNKLGDPNQKVASKVIYCLTQLLRVLPVMKQVVLNEIERLLFRSNIGTKAQYYSICFLSQYHFEDKDVEIAQNIISVYFSFFKASIKKGEVDSRMMAALLMGVNRAYPFAKLESNKLSEHVDTMFKLVHIANFNISVHALCLLYQIVGHSQDRFYVALYKKILDPHLAGSAHQAMFLNLLFKALGSDEDIGRVRVFIKRLLQICCYLPVPLVCGLLYTISHLVSKRPALLALTTHKGDTIFTADDDDSDGDEHYKDVPLQDEDLKQTEDLKMEKEIKEENPNMKSGWQHNLNKNIRNRITDYDPTARNPAFARGEKASYTELTDLSLHFHPTVSLFATKILSKQVITYTGDPLSDFTLVRFLERFVFKNPKQLAPGAGETGPDPALAQRKYYTPTGAKALPVDSEKYLSQAESKVPVDEIFLYRYLTQRNARVVHTKKGSDSDIESVASEDFEDMLRGIVGSSKTDLDFADDIADNLRKTKKVKGKKESESEEESEDENEEEGEETDLEDDEVTDLENVDDDDNEAIDFDGDDAESFDGEIDFNNLDEEINNSKRKTKKKNVEIKKIKGKKNQDDIYSLFAPAEQFSEMLEEAGTEGNKTGTANALSNKDKAAKKQLDWETSRHHWVSKKHKHNQSTSTNKGKRRKYQ